MIKTSKIDKFSEFQIVKNKKMLIANETRQPRGSLFCNSCIVCSRILIFSTKYNLIVNHNPTYHYKKYWANMEALKFKLHYYLQFFVTIIYFSF